MDSLVRLGVVVGLLMVKSSHVVMAQRGLHHRLGKIVSIYLSVPFPSGDSVCPRRNVLHSPPSQTSGPTVNQTLSDFN